MINELVPHETWDIIDSTKLQTYLRCPRFYMLKYVFGWVREGPSIHLDFGRAWSKAMDVLWSKGINLSNLQPSFTAFMEVWNEAAGVAPMELGVKSPENAERALHQYIDTYQNQRVKLAELRGADGEAIEIPGRVPLDDTRVLYLRMDKVVVDENDLYWVLDHKTASQLTSHWKASWDLSLQMGTYIHCLICIFGVEKVKGALIDGAIIRNPPKRRKDGEPYANSGPGTELIRVPIIKPVDQMAQWLNCTLDWMMEIESDLEVLDECTGDEAVLPCFKQNPTACTKWNRLCPYHDTCVFYSNPLKLLRRLGGRPPSEFVRQFWDPRVGEVVGNGEEV